MREQGGRASSPGEGQRRRWSERGRCDLGEWQLHLPRESVLPVSRDSFCWDPLGPLSKSPMWFTVLGKYEEGTVGRLPLAESHVLDSKDR